VYDKLLGAPETPVGGWGELPDSTSLSDSSLLRFVPVQSGA